MGLEFFLILVVCWYLRKSLKTAEKFPKWDKTLRSIVFASLGLFAIHLFFNRLDNITNWGQRILVIYLVYLLFSEKIFESARQVMFAITPYIILSLLKDTLLLISEKLFDDVGEIIDIGLIFTTLWMIVMLIIVNRQRKALDKQNQKLKEEEKQNKITVSLKAQLEVEVAQRTAELTLQKEELENTITELKATQAQLVQSEKMASLGELTAGIAHEIQNPLNFVNNFSEVNAELIEEMKNEIETGNHEEAMAIANDIKENALKITYHGKRADSIVKGMLQHSRTSGGEKEITDINALCDEYLRLSYHGLRAKDKTFNATMKTDFDTSIGDINIIPQDMGRVILNIINNAFYAAQLPASQNTQTRHLPTVWLATKKENGKISISIKDNGPGIPKDMLAKIFQPFFTTKPTGQGTGLGLSLAYDIVKAHGGELRVETKEGEGTNFIIQLPVV